MECAAHHNHTAGTLSQRGGEFIQHLHDSQSDLNQYFDRIDSYKIW